MSNATNVTAEARICSVILVFAWFFLGSQSWTFAATGVSDEPASLGWFYVATYGTPLLAYVMLRVLTVHFVLHFMMRRAPGQVGTELTDKQEAAALGREDIHFFELNSAKGILLNDLYEDRLERSLETGRQTWGIFCKALLAFTVTSAILYIYFRNITNTVVGAEAVNVVYLPATGWGVYLALVIVVFILFIAALIDRYYHTRRVSFTSCVGVLLILAALTAGVQRVLALPFYFCLLPPICSALIVVLGFYTIRRSARADSNIKLLILRVFGSDRNTSFVFGRLMRSWQFLGAFLTIVDPSYIKYQFSLSSSENRWKLFRFFTLFGLGITGFSLGQNLLLRFTSTSPALVAWQELSLTQQVSLLGMMAWLILIPLAVLPILAVVRNRFVQDLPDLHRRINAAQRQHGGWSGVFRGLPMYCYDNVWKQAVNALLQASDVVLMDLRGFSLARMGCEYEVGLLINQCPIQKIVFLVDHQTKQSVYSLIRRHWNNMSATSPNRALKSPTIKIYTPDDYKAARDIPRILALLVSSVETDGQSAGSMISFEGGQPRPSASMARAPWESGWRVLANTVAERLDMAVSTPRYFRVIMPVMLVAILGLFYVRVRPLVDSFTLYSNPKVAALPGPPSDALESVSEGLPTPAYLKMEINAKVSATAFGMEESVNERFNGVQVNGSFVYPIEVWMDFIGGMASQAYRVGHVKITSAISDTGDPLEVLSVNRSGFRDARTDFVWIDHSAMDFFTKQPEHPENGFRLTMYLFRPDKEVVKLRSLSGTVMLQTIDPARTVRIENIGSMLSGFGSIQLKHPKLDAVGESVLTIGKSTWEHKIMNDKKWDDPQIVHFIVKGKTPLGLGDARIVDLRCNIIHPRDVRTSTLGEDITTDFAFVVEHDVLSDARLDVFVGYRLIETPFNAKDVVIQK